MDDTYAIGAGSQGLPSGLVVADFNHDGIPDIAATNFGSNSVSVLMGKDEGKTAYKYQPRVNFATGTEPELMASGDLNGDGNVDLVVTDYDDAAISILYGKGDGTFRAAVSLPVGSTPSGLVVADLDSDGNLDIATADMGSNAISIYFGDGKGGYSARDKIATWGVPASIAVGDVNHDGKPDIAVGAGGGRVTMLVNTGARQFTTSGNFRAYVSSCDLVAIMTLHKGGDPDVVCHSRVNDLLVIMRGSGDGYFDDSDNGDNESQYNTGSPAFGFALTDVDGDGNTDLALVSAQLIEIYESTGYGGFLSPLQVISDLNLSGIAAGHFTQNSTPDFAVVSAESAAVEVMLGQNTRSFESMTTSTVGDGPAGIAIADFNSDGHLDLVSANSLDNTVTLLLGNGDGTFGGRADYLVGTDPTRVVAADFNGDSKTDLVTLDTAGNGVTVLLGTGTSTLGTRNDYAVGTSPVDVAVADLDGDGKLDIATADVGSSQVSILWGNGDGTFTGPTQVAVSDSPYAIAIGDIEGSGNKDIAVARYSAARVQVLHNAGSRSFTLGTSYAVGQGPVSVALKDLRGSGVLDIMVSNNLDSDVSVLLNQGSGSFAAAVTTVVDANPVRIVPAKLQSAGAGAITVSSQNSDITLLTDFSDGVFKTIGNLSTGQGVSDVATGDVNEDGRADIVVADRADNTLGVFLSSTSTAPTANDVTLSTSENTEVTGDLSATPGTSGDTLTYEIVSKPAHGSVTLEDQSSGAFRYTPTDGFHDVDSFTFRVTENGTVSNTATVTVTVSKSGGGGESPAAWLLLAGMGWLVRRRRGRA